MKRSVFPMIASIGRQRGGALATVIIALGLLTAITGSALYVVTNRFNTVHHSSAWQEALTAAEAGVHQGLAQLERGLKDGAIPTGTQTFTLNLPHAGESSGNASVQYSLIRNDVTAGGKTQAFYSIVSTGTVLLSGQRSLSLDSRDVVLRKLDLGGATRQATRSIEAWIKPIYSTDLALQVEKLIKLNNHKIYVDSFDSADPNRSLAGGQPGTAIGQFNVAPYNALNAHIATNGQFISAGDATVYGDALTNGGTVGGSSGILGEVRDDFYQPLAPVYPPDWSSSVTPGVPGGGGVTLNISSATTLRGGTAAAPKRYVVDSIKLNGSSDVLTFDFGKTGAALDTDKKYVEVYVRGDVTTKGAGGSSFGSMTIVNGVQVKIWVLGSTNFGGSGVSNPSGLATNFSLYGVNAPTPTVGQTIDLSGSAQFYGSVYAPGADVTLAGGGSSGTFVGSIVAKSATLNGNTKIRYDEALAGSGIIKRFEVATWFEDTKKQGSFPGKL